MTDLSIYDHDKTLYLFTSLTAGSSHIITATSRIETILKANKIPFQGVDTATDELARKLYGRRAGGRKLPLLVKEGYVIGDLAEVEEWNEFGELKEAIGDVEAPKGAGSSTAAAQAAPATKSSSTATAATPASTSASVAGAAPAPPQNKENAPPSQQTLAMRQLSTEAAAVGASKQKSTSTLKPQQPTSAQPPSAVPKEALPAPAAGDPNPTSRRRSSIPAPPEEIKAVEDALAIPEEEEEDDDEEEGDDEDEEDDDDNDDDNDDEEKVGAQRADAVAPSTALGTGSRNVEGDKKGGDAAAPEKAGESVLD
ncbi:hypothetical protein W97_01198 [Coniosporium apollinis CBS 100218]|uniref:Uncharacterized protein n=1 Tax=Coniosporium apollinis (strain CBS 100218) TaxID=1168221 RepID=R7YJ99_CONA1|nr:uncharacterized protein W97_01198 [Coniosporium apollinis CBS 100218]EON61980.1 hypothetical protein W97_01198 [Coniosporium apollinis CBS 100218]